MFYFLFTHVLELNVVECPTESFMQRDFKTKLSPYLQTYYFLFAEATGAISQGYAFCKYVVQPLYIETAFFANNWKYVPWIRICNFHGYLNLAMKRCLWIL